MKRTPLKRGSKPMKRNKPLAKVGQMRKKREREITVFDEIWAERPHVSQVSGLPLIEKPDFSNKTGWRMWVSQFSHLVPKGSYRGMRLRKENIVLKTFEEHRQWHEVPKSELPALHPGWEAIIRQYQQELAFAIELSERRILFKERKAKSRLKREAGQSEE